MSVLDTIVKTPIDQLNRINLNPKVKVYAKLDGSDPGGSVKDRIAHYMI